VDLAFLSITDISCSEVAGFHTFKPPNYLKFQRNYYRCTFLRTRSALFTHCGIFWSHYNSSKGSMKLTKDKVMKSMDVINGETSGRQSHISDHLGKIFLN